jgi:hypothetical protein
MRGAPTRFRLFVEAREQARLVKELVGGPPPHSNDPIIAVNRFCNINREDDAVTRWVKANVRDKLVFLEQGPEQLVVQLLATRIWNHPPTLAVILPVIIPAVALRKLDALRAAGGKTMRGAYMMPVHGNNGRGRTVDQYYMAAVEEAQTVTWRDMRSLAEVATRLVQIMGIGDFLANQVCADLRHTPWGAAMPDKGTFVLCGPGTRRGLDRYAGFGPEGPLNFSRTQQTYVARLLEIRRTLSDENFFNTTFYDPNNLANCFCEWDKHERVLHGETARLHTYP